MQCASSPLTWTLLKGARWCVSAPAPWDADGGTARPYLTQHGREREPLAAASLYEVSDLVLLRVADDHLDEGYVARIEDYEENGEDVRQLCEHIMSMTLQLGELLASRNRSPRTADRLKILIPFLHRAIRELEPNTRGPDWAPDLPETSGERLAIVRRDLALVGRELASLARDVDSPEAATLRSFALFLGIDTSFEAPRWRRAEDSSPLRARRVGVRPICAHAPPARRTSARVTALSVL